MAILVLAEHDNKSVKKATLNTVAAAQKLGGDIHVLVAGYHSAAAAGEAAKVAGVKKVLHADATQLGEFLAENVAALRDVQQISDIAAVEGADTFVRPVYAGNALATVKSKDAIKFITVRTTA